MSVKESGMIINFLFDRIFSPILYWQLKNKVKLYSPEKTNNTWDEVAQDEYLPWSTKATKYKERNVHDDQLLIFF